MSRTHMTCFWFLRCNTSCCFIQLPHSIFSAYSCLLILSCRCIWWSWQLNTLTQQSDPISITSINHVTHILHLGLFLLHKQALTQYTSISIPVIQYISNRTLPFISFILLHRYSNNLCNFLRMLIRQERSCNCFTLLIHEKSHFSGFIQVHKRQLFPFNKLLLHF